MQITWKHTLIVIESLTNKFINQSAIPFVKVFPPQMLSSSSEGAIVQAVPIAFAPVIAIQKMHWNKAFQHNFREILQLINHNATLNVKGYLFQVS